MKELEAVRAAIGKLRQSVDEVHGKYAEAKASYVVLKRQDKQNFSMCRLLVKKDFPKATQGDLSAYAETHEQRELFLEGLDAAEKEFVWAASAKEAWHARKDLELQEAMLLQSQMKMR